MAILGRLKYENGTPVIGHANEKHFFPVQVPLYCCCFNPDGSRMKKSPLPHYADGPMHFAFAASASSYEKTKKEILEKGFRIEDEVKCQVAAGLSTLEIVGKCTRNSSRGRSLGLDS